MMLKAWLVFGAVSSSLASPLPIDGKHQNALVEQDPEAVMRENMRLINLSPTDTRWMTQEQLKEVRLVSLKDLSIQTVQF
jgi:hypothetical protein